MKQSAWRILAIAGCLLVLVLVAARPAAAQAAQNIIQSNLPRYVVIRDGSGRIWNTLSYAYDTYEYYRVGSGGTIRSDSPRYYTLNAAEHWTLESNGHGYSVYGPSGAYKVTKWFKEAPASGGSAEGTAGGITGDWKVLDGNGHTLYYVESVESGYTVLDKNMHIATVVRLTDKGFVVTNKGNKVLWKVTGTGQTGGLAVAMYSLPHVDPWAKLLMGTYFFPDWW
ncbi:MAG: hypothetical protein ACYCW6_22615 [Candidatus Xenobia bacterium]